MPDGYCMECGQAMYVEENGVSYHLDTDGSIDYEQDADHVAYLDVEADVEKTSHNKFREY